MEQKKHWQSFGELNQSEAFNKEVKDEFTSELPMVEDHSGFLSAKAPRRDFLKYVGFSTAAAAVAASCEMLSHSRTNLRILFLVLQNIMQQLMCKMVM